MLTAINPATGETIAQYDEHTSDQIEDALKRGADRFTTWRSTTFEERRAMMRNAAGLLRERKERYGELMTCEMGKPIAAAEAEVEKCAWVCEYYADNAGRFLADEQIASDASDSHVAFQPIGLVLAIMPWNFPFWQCFRFAAPALMAGNTAILKHASNVPGSALAIEEVFRDAGFPEGCFRTLLVGSAAIAGIIDDPRVAAVTLTGSEGAGRSVGEASGRNLKKVVLELGGSDPFIVMPTADLESAVGTAVTARTINNGQSCIAAKRFIVHSAIADEFEQRFAEGLAALKIGDPVDRSVAIGPLARPEFVDDLERQVRESVERGARIVTGRGKLEREGYFFAPTLLTNVKPGMPAYDEETFGPVAAVIRVDDIDGAIHAANDSRFGLGASAWTGERTEQERFAREIEAGSVFINGMVKSDPRLPFGGIKMSGIGRELGSYGIREFVNIKTIWIKMLLIFLLALPIAACGDKGPRYDDQGNSVEGTMEAQVDQSSSTFNIINLLRASGNSVKVTGKVSRPQLDAKGWTLVVNGGVNLEVYEFSSPEDLQEATKKISLDGKTIEGESVNWPEAPHLYKTDRVIVVYLGDDIDNRKRLAETFGPQFAGM